MYFSGRVQGVGFRYTVRGIAERLRRPGLRAELERRSGVVGRRGRRRSLEAFISAVRAEMERYIVDTQDSVLPANGEFTDFEVRR